MFKNYFITIWRQMLRKPGFYLLNISGLAVGIAAFVLMFEYASYELSFDKFHRNADDLYRVNLNYQIDGRPPYKGAAVYSGLGPAMKAELPQVADYTRLVSIWGGGGIVRFGENRLKAPEIQYAESSLFQIFDLEVLEGDAGKGLDNVHTAMISEPLRARLFEGQQGVGETVEVLTRDGEQNYLITGVYQVPDNSHYKSDMLLSFSSLQQLLGIDLDSHWAWFDYITYVKLQPGTDPETVEAYFPTMAEKYLANRNRNGRIMDFDLMPVSDIHLHSHINQEIAPNGDYQTVVFLLVIAMLILSVAWINYINLYTAKAAERGKEVGIRKTLGSGKRMLRIQFLLEAFVINLIAMVLGLFLVYTAIPVLANTLDMHIPADLFTQPGFWLRMLLLWSVGSVLSGLYPALMISAYEPLKAIRSASVKQSGKMRKVLVVWQFMASAALIIGASTVYNQLEQMNSQPTGMDTESVVVVNVPQFRSESLSYYQSINQLKNAYLSYTGVESVSYASDVPGKQVGWRGGSRLIGTDSEAGGMIYKMVIGQDYLGMYDISLLSGRNFERASDSLSVILNETALPLYGFTEAETALGKRIYFAGVDTLTVVGVVADHYQESLKEPIKPTAFLQMEEELMYLFVRLPESQIASFTDFAQAEFETSFPELTFDWQLLSAGMADRHSQENSFFKAFNVFVLLSFFISSLGLIGLASYMARKRQKEMGLRKVLGSSVGEIVVLFFRDFTRLALIGNLITLPLIFYFSNQWLDQFAFRTDFIWWLPLIALGITIGLACLATVYHVLKVARVNPANVLSHE